MRRITREKRPFAAFSHIRIIVVFAWAIMVYLGKYHCRVEAREPLCIEEALHGV